MAVNPQGIDQDGHSLHARQVAVRQRADRLPGVKLRQRSGSYWLDGVDGNVVTLSNRMTLDELEQELTRLSRTYADGCQGRSDYGSTPQGGVKRDHYDDHH